MAALSCFRPTVLLRLWPALSPASLLGPRLPPSRPNGPGFQESGLSAFGPAVWRPGFRPTLRGLRMPGCLVPAADVRAFHRRVDAALSASFAHGPSCCCMAGVFSGQAVWRRLILKRCALRRHGGANRGRCVLFHGTHSFRVIFINSVRVSCFRNPIYCLAV